MLFLLQNLNWQKTGSILWAIYDKIKFIEIDSRIVNGKKLTAEYEIMQVIRIIASDSRNTYYVPGIYRKVVIE